MRVQNKIGAKIKSIKSGNRGKFVNSKLVLLWDENEIAYNFSCP